MRLLSLRGIVSVLRKKVAAQVAMREAQAAEKASRTAKNKRKGARDNFFTSYSWGSKVKRQISKPVTLSSCQKVRDQVSLRGLKTGSVSIREKNS